MKKFLIAALVAISTAASAIDMSTQITNLNGKPLTDDKGAPINKTLGDVIEEALLAPDAQASKEDKNKRFWLAIKIHGQKDVVLTADEITMTKDIVSKMFPSPLILGQVSRLLDPADKPKP